MDSLSQPDSASVNSPEALRELIEAEFPQVLPQTLSLAKAVIQKQFTLFGRDVQYQGPIAWQSDPISGAPWPQVFYADVPLTDDALPHGDVKYVWELNRHQYLIELGKAYWLTGEPAYADAVSALLGHWIESNAYNTGVNWTNALEPAYRVFAWIWTYSWCGDALCADFLVSFLKSLYQHACYIEAHLEFYTSPYNHLIGEATALFWIGTLFPEFKDAERWAARGWQILESELEHQFYADGFTVEQASGYHYATLGFYLMAVLLRQLNGKPVSARVLSSIERAITCSVHLTQPNGRVPRIGDSDEARPMALSQRPPWDFREFHTMGAVLFSRPDFKYAAGGYAEEALWMLGVSGYRRFANLQSVAPSTMSQGFQASGYYVMRSGWNREAHWSCVDCGPQAGGISEGAVPSAAHGHADALSVLISAYGEPMLVDAGSYAYNGDPVWYDYFRQTRAHNTVVVDGLDQAVHHGGMAWSQAAKTQCEAWDSTPLYDYVCGHHAGFTRLPVPVWHRRAVFFRKPTYWLIFDELTGTGLHQVESYLHFAPAALKAIPDGITATFASGRQLTVRLAGAPLEASRCATHEPEQPSSDWMGVGYGRRRAAPVACWHAHLVLPQRWCMLATCTGDDWQLDCCEGEVVVRGNGMVDRFGWPGDSQPMDVGETVARPAGGLWFQLDGASRTEIAGVGTSACTYPR